MAAAGTTPSAYIHLLRRALESLYDPTVLRNSPLIEMFGLAGRPDPTHALQRILHETVEVLQPADSVPATANAWRVYQILHYHYVEQFTQREVATDLALSIRQLRRQQALALQVLADALWQRYATEPLAAAWGSLLPPGTDPSAGSGGRVSQADELALLKNATTGEAIHLRDLVQGVLRTLEPLVQSLGAQVTCEVSEALPPVRAQAVALRQGLISLVATALRAVPG